MFVRYVLRLLLALAALFGVAAQAAAPELRIGVLAPEGRNSDVLRSWTFLEPYLQKALPEYQVSVESYDLDRLREAVAAGRLHFFLANSGFFVEAEVSHGAAALVTVDMQGVLKPDAALASAVVVLAQRTELQDLADLRNARVLAVNENAFGGYQIGLHALWRAGVERHDLAQLRFTGFPVDQLLWELAAGRADAAIMRLCLYERLVASPQFANQRFRVLGRVQPDAYGCARSTPLYPDWPFARTKATDTATAKRVAVALLAMPPTAQGHAWTVPTDYGQVHQLFRDLRIGPYAYLDHQTFGQLVKRNWQWLALLPLLLLGFILHTVRAERLVQRRTRDLRAALAERDRLAAEARRRDEEMQQLSRLGALGEMSSMIAHELNQPLAAIGNFARGIVRRLEAGRGEAPPLIEAGNEIAHQAERAGAVIQRVRSLAQRRPYERQQTAPAALIRQALATFAAALPQAPSVALDFEGDAAVSLSVDALQIEQVLLNLLRNGVEAMREVPPAQRELRLTCTVEERSVRFAVSDAGVGLKNAGGRLFEPFFTTKPDGVGLGLAVCKRVVEAHGGRIEVRSNAPAPGVTVAFTLPREPLAAAVPVVAAEVQHA